MIDPGSAVKESIPPVSASPSGAKLAGAAVFGLAFGFLLQKGGAAKYHVLQGQLLLQDFTVLKIMLTAIVVGMLGVHLLHHFARVNLHLKPTRLGAQIIGGLLFGCGFALLAYCPGTVAVALGEGSWDALFGIGGLVVGSYLYAELSAWLKVTVEKWGEKGKITLPELFHMNRGLFVVLFAILLVGVLFVLEHYWPR